MFNTMKKISLALTSLVLGSALPAVAQNDAGIALAPQFAYGSRWSDYGLGLQVQIQPISNFRIAPEFIYFFENDDVTTYNANINFQYVIQPYSSVSIYPIAGFTYIHYDGDGWNDGYSDDRYGGIIGVGAEYHISNNASFFTEERYQLVKDYSQSLTMLGFKYKF